MSLPLVINGITYNYPQQDDVDWGPDATDWASAVTVGMLQKAGGLFQLLAEVDFGTSYGVKSLYLKSRTANPADAGQIRLARADVINWRNQASDGNLSLGVSSSNILQFNGTNIQNTISVSDTATIDLTFVADALSADIKTDSITNSMINSAAAIAYSKLALTGAILNADINASAAIAYSKLALSNSIVNADVNSSAAIAYSKLALTGSILNADINASAAIAYSKLALTGSIVNADINASAAIAYSKLALSDSIVNADINSAAAIAYSKLALTGAIVNADVNASAAIAFSKLATLSSANILVGSAGNVATSVAVTGDVTITNAGVTAIGTAKVVNAMLANMAESTIKGRAAGAGTGVPVDLTATQATAILNNMVGDSGSGGTKGLVPAPASGDASAGKFLKADGTWVAPSGAGDVVGPASSTDNGFAKFNGTTGKLIKNSAATLVNADIDASAAIAFSKLAALTSAHILVGSAGNVATDVAVSGDISLTNAGVTAYSGTVPVLKGGTGQTSFTDGQLMIGNTSGNTLTKATLTQGANVTITNGNGTITIAASSTAQPAWSYVAQSSTLNPAVLGTYYNLSGASFTITLPTAASVAGQGFTFQHNGTSLTQVYTFNTTSAQTIGGVASGSYALYTAGEVLYIVSDGANWQILKHFASTAWTSAANVITATSAYVFTWTGSQNVVIGDTYSDGSGHTYTVSASTNTTTGTFSGTANPAATGTLTRVTGSGVSSVAWNSRTTTGAPAKASSPNVDLFYWRRVGDSMEFRINYAAASATGGVNGSGDYLWQIPDFTNMAIDTTKCFATLVVGYNNGLSATSVGTGLLSISGSSDTPATVSVYNKSYFRFSNANSASINGGASYGFANGNLLITFNGTVAMVGWQP